MRRSTARYSITILPAHVKPPYQLELLCDWLGIEIVVRPLPQSVSGLYLRTSRGPTIFINALDGRHRRRWTLAHEIAHHLYGLVTGNGAAFDLTLAAKGERHCDRFAAELLMPARLVRQLAIELGHANPDMTAPLAQLFNVSKMAMRIRLKELALIS